MPDLTDTKLERTMRYFLNRAIATVVSGDARATDYYAIAKKRNELDKDDGSYDAIMEYYLNAAIALTVAMYENKQSVGDEEFVNILVKSFIDSGVGETLIEYFAKGD